MKLFIKNMACESCRIVVKETLQELDLQPVKVELGEVQLKEKPSEQKKKKLNDRIRKAGMELVENKGSILIERIKKHIRDYAYSTTRPSQNLSDYLSSRLKYDYTYLSNLFTGIEDMTISEYLSMLKIEYAKELMLLEGLKISEVSKKLHYSYPSHFTSQFKKITGLTPTAFMESKEKKRLAVHELARKGNKRKP